MRKRQVGWPDYVVREYYHDEFRKVVARLRLYLEAEVKEGRSEKHGNFDVSFLRATTQELGELVESIFEYTDERYDEES